MWKTITSRGRLLSEAPVEGEDYQLTQEDLGSEKEDYKATEIPGADPAAGQPAQQGAGMGEDPAGGEMGDSMGMEDPNGAPQDAPPLPDPMAEPSLPGETESDKIKKLVLLEQYKKLIELCEQGYFTLSYLTRLNEFKDDETLVFLKKSIDNLNKKIVDVVSYHFLNTEYVELLRKFYYLKYNLMAITSQLDKFSKKYASNLKN